ncbi:MAG: YafY family transcriptional regulator, partial [Reichenbachiella sp.]
IHLQSKSRIPLDELEDRFAIGRRTVFRDIKALMEAGVPIGGDAGEGYFIVEGYRLPPVVFNKEEASALLLGGKLLAPKADPKTTQAFQDALYKIKAVLRYSDKEYLTTLEDKVVVHQRRTSNKEDERESFFLDIQKAVAENRTIQMHYFSNYKEEYNDRKVAPLGLIYYNDNWHLIAHCFLRNGIRDFRTNRIKALCLSEECFDPSEFPNYDEFLKEQISRYQFVEAEIEIHNSITKYITDEKYRHGFVSEQKGSEWTQMKFQTPDIHYFARWVILHGKHANIISPESLKQASKTLSQEIFEHYKGK